MERRFSAFSGVRAERDRSRPRKTDGSGISASPRGNSRARRHDTGLPRARNPNRKDKNGTGCRVAGLRQPYKDAATRSAPFARQYSSIVRRTGRWRRRSLAPRDLARHLPEQHLDLGSCDRPQRRRHGARQRSFIEARGQAHQQIPSVELGAAQAEAFARDPFHEIACRSPRGELLAHDEPEPGCLACGPRIDDEMRRASPRAQTKNG